MRNSTNPHLRRLSLMLLPLIGLAFAVHEALLFARHLRRIWQRENEDQH